MLLYFCPDTDIFHALSTQGCAACLRYTEYNLLSSHFLPEDPLMNTTNHFK